MKVNITLIPEETVGSERCGFIELAHIAFIRYISFQDEYRLYSTTGQQFLIKPSNFQEFEEFVTNNGFLRVEQTAIRLEPTAHITFNVDALVTVYLDDDSQAAMLYLLGCNDPIPISKESYNALLSKLETKLLNYQANEITADC